MKFQESLIKELFISHFKVVVHTTVSWEDGESTLENKYDVYLFEGEPALFSSMVWEEVIDYINRQYSDLV
jgi:hypothetical protein